MKIFIVIIITIFISSCSREVDYSKPHEYIDWVSASDGYSSMENNDHRYSGIGVVPKTNWFPLGEGKCLKYLNKINMKEADRSMQGFNYYLQTSNNFNDKRIRHVKYRCIEYKGEVEGCRDKYLNMGRQFITEKSIKAMDAMGVYLRIDLEAEKRCKVRSILGETAIFHHYGYENDVLE